MKYQKQIFCGVVGVLAVGALVVGSVALWRGRDMPSVGDTGVRFRVEDHEMALLAPGQGGDGVRYFGNGVEADIDGDGTQDRVFLVTYDGGGSGTFYYLVGELARRSGVVGTSGYFLGDRIAPQTTEVRSGEAGRTVVVVNYADRAPGEPMTTQPSEGKTVHLRLSPDTTTWEAVIM